MNVGLATDITSWSCMEHYVTLGYLASRFSELTAVLLNTQTPDGQDLDHRGGASGAVTYLEESLNVSGYIKFTDDAGREIAHEHNMAYFDHATNLVILDYFIGDGDAERQRFYGRLFGLSAEEIAKIHHDDLSFIVFHLPEGYEVTQAVAVMATGDDAWQTDGYTMPAELRDKILREARTAGLTTE